MNRQRSTLNNSNGIFFYLEVPKGLPNKKYPILAGRYA
ncbi:hypothetical protein GXM_04892 [Nostoc sphaeroides CCNUC1]|uniref:Uncharacterized protein n=1 Tax=Nostoc sphaeroides CCNUC1 TaxID=2653204 RepID=A0A5P8W434_9NOSO|nr:hypothetical protein GXM_04892 [Nostoc sphaeroides CCNUC1]